MKILIITAKRAEKEVKKIAKELNCSVLISDSEIASLIKEKDINFKEIKRKEPDLILLPGYCSRKLAEKIEERTGVKTFLGPKNIHDLGIIIENIEKVFSRLSKYYSADEVLREEIKKLSEKELEKAESRENTEKLIKEGKAMRIGSVVVSEHLPMRIVAEIAHADRLGKKELAERADYFKKSGAGIIVLGFSESSGRREIKEKLSYVREKIKIPVGIDSDSIDEIEAAINSGAELIMSFDRSMLERFSDVENACVIIPEKNCRSYEEKTKSIMENIKLAQKRGFKNIIADLILEPLNFGFTDSVIAYKKFSEKIKKKNKFIPVLFGAGNITELIDADSHGVNALLAGIASEVNASLIFTTEASDKTKGSIRELYLALRLFYLAKLKKAYPKDLGINLLFLKEKRKKHFIPDFDMSRAKIINAFGSAMKKEKVDYDKKGNFVIFTKDNLIFVAHFPRNSKKADLIIRGKTAREIAKKITELELISNCEHALYIGRELEKAEIAIKTGRSYIQEEEVF